MLSRRRKWIGVAVLAAWIGSGVAWLSLGRARAADGPITLQVSLSERQLRVVEGDSTIVTYGVAVGRPSNPTPTGTFETGDIIWNPSWTPPPSNWAAGKSYQPPGAPSNPMQAVKIYFRAPDLYIHGTNDPGSIGEAASHGCLRMVPDDASALAHRIEDAGGHVPLIISP
jgi:lipoprotein-anchoring transpeptidase ErfK/SrfK